jgi:hypothetical protein
LATMQHLLFWKEIQKPHYSSSHLKLLFSMSVELIKFIFFKTSELIYWENVSQFSVDPFHLAECWG